MMKCSAFRVAMLLLGAAVAASAGTAQAATKSTAKSTKPPAKAPAAPAIPPDVVVVPTPVTKIVSKVPEAIRLRPTTTAEAEANAVWNVRAALNIAALQCQFLPFLATVRTYNDILRQHSEELNDARLTMLAHFKRYDGAKAQTSFDQYTTRTYNSFSTIDAQLPFCEEAGSVGREVLATRKGKMGPVAMRLNPVLRASLEPGFGLPRKMTIVDMTPVALPDFAS